MYFYLVERHTDQIKGQVDSMTSNVNGKYVVPVQDKVAIDETATSKGNNSNLFEYEDLLDQKYNGILANNPSYDFIEWDDLLDDSVWDTNLSGTRGGVGKRRHFLSKATSGGSNGFLQTNTFDISSKGSFSRFAMYWDAYTLNNQESDFRRDQMYTHIDPDDIDAFISNDGGNTFIQASFMQEAVFTSSGDQVILQFQNPDSSRRIYLGGLAFLF